MNNQTLELQLKTTGEQTLNVLDKTLNRIGKLQGAFSKLFTVMGAKRIGLKAMDFFDSAVNRAEELNLFNVIFKNIEKDGVKTFSTLGRESMKFQKKLNEAFGTNMTETLRYQGLFQAMATNQGISEDKAAIMSENMLKLTYDLASLYNRSEKATAEALRAGVYAGQTKPLRSFGIDVTQQSMKPTLAALGITDRTVNDMNQAEKQILRYISTLYQAKSAMGDFAETIESPANQLKIFKQQLVEVKVAWANLFMGMYADILPYANAILMVLKEIAKAIANIFGIESRDYNTGIASLEDTYDAFEDIGTGAGNATKAAKELKRQVLGFDQINNLTTPSKTGSGGGVGSGGLTGGIDKRLLDAISGYDNLMDKVRMKATEIRDRWMEILGFKKVINPLTGEVEFKYQGLGTTIKNLAKWFGNLSGKGKLFVGLGLEIIFGKIFSAVSKLLGKLISTDTAMGKFLTGVGGKMTTVVKGMAIATTGVLTLNAAMDDMAHNGINWGNQIAGLAGSLATMFGAAQIGSIFGPIGSLIGGIIGGIGTLITAIGGIGDAFDEEQIKINNAREESQKKIDDWTDSVKKAKDMMTDSDDEMAYYQGLKDELDTIVDKNGKVKKGYEDRAEVITGILSEAFGIEIKVVDGVIQKYDELEDEIDNLILQKKALAKLNILEEGYNDALKNIKKANKDVSDSYKYLNDLIFDQNVLIEKNAEKYGLTNDEMTELFDKVNKDPFGFYSKELREMAAEYENLNTKINTQNEVYQNNIKVVENYQNTIDTFEKAYGLSLKKNYKALDEYLSGEAQLLGEDEKTKAKYWKNEKENAEKHLKELADNRSNYLKEEYDELVAADEEKIKKADEYFDRLEALNKTRNGEITDEVIEQWIKMGEESVENALLEYQKLPPQIQEKLQYGMTKAGTELGWKLQEGLTPEEQEMYNKAKTIVEQLQKGFNSVKLEKSVIVTAQDKASQTINNIINKYKNNPLFKPLFNAIGAAKGGIFEAGNYSQIPQFANGGLPNHGTLFAAGEHGAEIVGNINRRTEVLNRSQIASAIYTAVSDAMRNVNIGGGEIHFYAHTDEGVVIDKINQKTKQTGRCPINIPA